MFGGEDEGPLLTQMRVLCSGGGLYLSVLDHYTNVGVYVVRKRALSPRKTA